MKFLVIGLGSMGKRRVRNLQALGHKDIVGFDPRADRCAEAHEKYDIETTAEWDEAEALTVDAWVISTPPETHFDYGLKAAPRGIHFFCEANVTDPRAEEMMAALKKSGTVGAPSSTMRYFAGPKKLKALLSEGAIGKPLTFTYHTGQYLPDWHPWESYKDFYVSNRDTGACREIVPFELSWMLDLFGPAERLSAMRDKLSDLECDIDDVYHLLLKFDSGMVGHLMVDVLSRPAFRVFRILGSHGSIEWDHGAGVVKLWTVGAEPNTYDLQTCDLSLGTVESGYIHGEEPYIEEMSDFVAACRGERPWPFSLEKDEVALEHLIRAERSSDQGQHT